MSLWSVLKLKRLELDGSSNDELSVIEDHSCIEAQLGEVFFSQF